MSGEGIKVQIAHKAVDLLQPTVPGDTTRIRVQLLDMRQNEIGPFIMMAQVPTSTLDVEDIQRGGKLLEAQLGQMTEKFLHDVAEYVRRWNS